LEFWRSSTDAVLSDPRPQQVVAGRAWPLYPEGHPADLYYSDTAAIEIADIMANFKPHLVVIEGLSLYRYIEGLKRFDCRLVLDCHNVEAAVAQEIAEATPGNDPAERLIREVLPTRTKMIEQKVVKTVDQIWLCSDNEAWLVERLYGLSTPIQIIPNGVDVDHYKVARVRSCDPLGRVNWTKKVLIFSALFGWRPNSVAACFLIKEFFPRLARVFPDCRLVLAGDRPTLEMCAEARGESRIAITGAVADMRPYLAAASVMVVPLFQGGGTRFKILEAFAAQVPVISTAKGAEGLTVQDGIHLMFAETADEFVHAVQRLWSDERIAQDLVANGLELVKQSYSAPVISHQIAKAIGQLNLGAY
jgi:glycosyltransferase involved in cell wall biosynthesis